MTIPGAPLFVGIVLAWSLAALPGPANALIATEASKRGFKAGVTTGLGAITADLGMFLLMWLGIVRWIESAPWLRVALGLVGAALLARFAWGAWRSAKSPVADSSARGAGRIPKGASASRLLFDGYAKCFLVIVTSPLNWVWWASAGTTIFAQFGLAVVFGFFGGLLAWIAFWAILTREGARRVARFSEGIAYASAVVLALFAAIAAWSAVSTLITIV